MRLPAVFMAAAALLTPLAAAAHITVAPKLSDLGAREKYVIRAPNEKRVSTVKIEAQFPAEARITAFEQAPGWTIESRRDAAGAIVGAVWSGDLPPEQFVEFGVMAANPKTGSRLTWTFTQVYADGSRVDWAGPEGSKTPAPTVELRAPAARDGRP